MSVGGRGRTTREAGGIVSLGAVVRLERGGGTFELDQVCDGEVFAGDGVGAVLGDVGFYQAFLEDGARL